MRAARVRTGQLRSKADASAPRTCLTARQLRTFASLQIEDIRGAEGGPARVGRRPDPALPHAAKSRGSPSAGRRPRWRLLAAPSRNHASPPRTVC